MAIHSIRNPCFKHNGETARYLDVSDQVGVCDLCLNSETLSHHTIIKISEVKRQQQITLRLQNFNFTFQSRIPPCTRSLVKNSNLLKEIITSKERSHSHNYAILYQEKRFAGTCAQYLNKNR